VRYSLLIFIIGSLSGITFERTYGIPGYNEWAEAVGLTPDGYILGGTTDYPNPYLYYRIYLVRTDSLGDTIWTTTSLHGHIRAILATPDGGYLYLSQTPEDWELVKINPSGGFCWRQYYGGDSIDEPQGMIEVKDGYLLVGGTRSYGAGGSDLWLIRVDSLGNQHWDRFYGGVSDDIGYDLDQAKAGFIITGATASYGSGLRDVLLIRTDSIGDSLWMRVYGGPDDDIGMAVRATPDGGFIIAGATYSFGAGSYDVYLIKTDSLGDTLWMRTYGGPDWDGGFGLCLSADSCYVIVGETRSYGFGLSDLYLLKVGRDGNLSWEKTYGCADEDRGYEVYVTPDHGFIIVGATRGEHGNDWEVYLLKVDSLGNIGVSESPGYDLPIRIYPNPSPGWLFIDGDGVSSVTLFDVSGRELRRLSVSRRVKLDLPAGIYFLKIETEAGPIHQKILILK